MRINRSYALAATAWLVLVVVGALLVWTVISRAGEGVLAQPESPIGAVAPVTSPPPAKRAEHAKSRKPTKQHPSKSASAKPGRPSAGAGSPRPGSSSSTPSAGPTPSAPPATGAGPKPTPGPGPGPGPGPKQSPNHPPPSPNPSAPSPSQQQSQGVQRTWQGSAGAVTVECNGANISLKGAQPNSGWSIDIDRRGPDQVRIDFESNDGERRTRVQSQCVGGTPRFDVDQGDD